MARYVFTLWNKSGNLLFYDESEPNEEYLGFWRRCIDKILSFKKSRSLSAPMSRGFKAEIEDLHEGEVVKSWVW